MESAAVAAALQNTTALQGALRVLATLQLTASLFPPHAHPTDGALYDFIVVGAGSAGCVLASRLSERGHSVLLVEAGPDPPLESLLPSLLLNLPKSQYDWNYTSEYDGLSALGHKRRTVELTRGRMLGGSGALNYMAYVRGAPLDYRAWARAARDSAWDYQQLLQYFIKSERLEDPEVIYSPYGPFHGVDGYLGVTRQPHEENLKYLDAFREIGENVLLDVNGYDTVGYTQPMFTIAQGVRQSTAYAFLSPIKRRPNLHVLKNTLATKIIFDENKSAIGVEVYTENNETLTLKSNKEVILSAGAFNTPQLLMLSGIGPTKHLRSFNIDVIADLPVGHNLQDHVGVLLFFKMQESKAPPPPTPKPTDFPGTLFMGFSALNKRERCAEYETENFVVPHDSPSILQFCSFVFGLRDDICQSVYDDVRGREVLFTIINILQPESRGKVLLRSTNPTDPPLVYTGYLSDDMDVENMARYIEDFVRVGNSSMFRRAGAAMAEVHLPECAALRRGSRRYWRCYARHMQVAQYHYGGTSALGAVLDARLRVRGVRRLRVADASAMPTLTRGNINAPVIMLAEKAADMIKEDYGL